MTAIASTFYRPEFFSVQEFVTPGVHKLRGEKAWELLNPNLLIMADELRRECGPMVINTWHDDKLSAAYGLRRYSGLRTFEYWLSIAARDTPIEETLLAYNTSMSQHKLGNAFDAIFRDVTAAQARDVIRNNREKYSLITCIEKGTSWLHADCRNVKGLIEVNG